MLPHQGSYTFADGLQYEEVDWDYCIDNDRRFYSERCNGLRPAGLPCLASLRCSVCKKKKKKKVSKKKTSKSAWTVSGESQLTDRHPPLVIPAGCYDCGNGFYDPNTRVVTTYDGDFLRNAGEAGAKVTGT